MVPTRILLNGTFDVDNYGDCIFPDIVSQQLSRHIPRLELQLASPTARPARIGTYSRLTELPPVLDNWHRMPAVDAGLLAGGETLTYGHTAGGIYCNLPTSGMSAGMRLWASLAALRIHCRMPFAVYSVGVGNLDEFALRALAKILACAEYVSVRDAHSLDRLAAYGVRPALDVDLGFAIPSLRSPAQWQEIAAQHLPRELKPQQYVVVHASLAYVAGRFSRWCDAVAQVAKSLGMPVLLLPICHHLSDRMVLAEAERHLVLRGVRCSREHRRLRTHETASLLAASAGYCGTSLHGAVTAIAFGRPAAVMGACANGKHAGVLSVVGASDASVLEPESLPGAFARGASLPLQEIAARALGAVEQACARVAASLAAGAKPLNDVDGLERVLAEARDADLMTAAYGPRSRAKRLVFSLLRRSASATETYEWISAKCRRRFA